MVQMWRVRLGRIWPKIQCCFGGDGGAVCRGIGDNDDHGI